MLELFFNVSFNADFKIVLDSSLVHQLVNKKTLIISGCTVCVGKKDDSVLFIGSA